MSYKVVIYINDESDLESGVKLVSELIGSGYKSGILGYSSDSFDVSEIDD